jgi:hypothetical protein
LLILARVQPQRKAHLLDGRVMATSASLKAYFVGLPMAA